MQVRFDESAYAMEEAVAIRQELLGPDHQDTVDAKILLASAALFFPTDREAMQEARTYLAEGLGWRLMHLRNDHPETTIVMVALAIAMLNLGEVAEAAPLLNEAITALRKNPQTESAGLAIAELVRSSMMWSLNQREAAVNLSRKAVDQFRKFSGDDHTLFAYIAGSHVNHLLAINRSDEAKQFCQEWLKNLRDRGSPAVFLATIELLKTLRSDGMPHGLDDAESVCRDWFQAPQYPSKRSTNQDAQLSYLFAEVLARKAEITADRQFKEEAEQWYRKAFLLAMKSLPEHTSKHHYTNSMATVFTNSVFRLGSILRSSARAAEAEELYLEALQLGPRTKRGFHRDDDNS